MLDNLYKHLSGTSTVPVVVIAVAIMLLAGFLATRITKLLKLPNVTAYILVGILLGPFCLNVVPDYVISGMDFISDIALAFIAFGMGEFFRFSTIKKNGAKVALITLFEGLAASVLVFVLTFFILGLGLPFSIILAALASATAPASTMMTIRQTGAKGDFVDTLFSVVALDDVLSLVAFSVAISIALASLGGGFSAGDVLIPIAFNIMMIGIGIGGGFLLKFLMAKRSNDNRLIVSIALLFAICGIGAAVDVSPLLGCMAMGTVYINVTGDDKLFKQLNYFSPPILLLFFVKSGLGFRLDALVNMQSSIGGIPLLVIGILYFVVRILGKYGGAFLGCLVTKKPKPVRNFLGFALVPQAGVAIGLAALGARILGGDTGSMLQTIILSSSILYELVGPALAKLSLYLSGSYGKEEAEDNPEKQVVPIAKPTHEEEVAALKQKLCEIQNAISVKEYARSPEEEAFLEATDLSAATEYNRRKFINKR
ncbi:MAG: cation:proton antiporter [Clostridiales bacterium]|nr:cation:proton antiporter [Clostridiales bacterium]